MNPLPNVRNANVMTSYIPKVANNVANNVTNNAVKFANNAAKVANNAARNLNTGIGSFANSAVKGINSGLSAVGNVVTNTANTLNSAIGNAASVALPSEGRSVLATIGIWFVILLIAAIGIFVFFYNEIMEVMPEGFKEFMRKVRSFFGIQEEPTPVKVTTEPAAPAISASSSMIPIPPPSTVITPTTGSGDGISMDSILSIPKDIMASVEKQLPLKKEPEVFTVKENRYTYDDAEPLCKAMGAELATYEQVKEAWDNGADWCNYGWVQGQMAIYPTQPETYEKLQKGTKAQRTSCGKPGVNGGFFDNPALKFGVTCYGVKPPQKNHDATLLPSGEANPYDPDALEFDKKVAEFQAMSENIGILPFKAGDWTGAD
jgi:hypothetical protein